MEMKEKLQIACMHAADLFELEPSTFCTYAYARLGGREVVAPLTQSVRTGDAFCAVGSISYLADVPRCSCASFLQPHVWNLFGARYSAEWVNNELGIEAVIRLLREAAIRTEPTSEAAAK